MDVCYECYVLSGRDLCDGLIIRLEESYRLWYVVVCDLETSKNKKAMARVGSQRHREKYGQLIQPAEFYGTKIPFEPYNEINGVLLHNLIHCL